MLLVIKEGKKKQKENRTLGEKESEVRGYTGI